MRRAEHVRQATRSGYRVRRFRFVRPSSVQFGAVQCMPQDPGPPGCPQDPHGPASIAAACALEAAVAKADKRFLSSVDWQLGQLGTDPVRTSVSNSWPHALHAYSKIGISDSQSNSQFYSLAGSRACFLTTFGTLPAAPGLCKAAVLDRDQARPRDRPPSAAGADARVNFNSAACGAICGPIFTSKPGAVTFGRGPPSPHPAPALRSGLVAHRVSSGVSPSVSPRVSPRFSPRFSPRVSPGIFRKRRRRGAAPATV
jgi:hypothetical protein